MHTLFFHYNIWEKNGRWISGFFRFTVKIQKVGQSWWNNGLIYILFPSFFSCHKYTYQFCACGYLCYWLNLLTCFEPIERSDRSEIFKQHKYYWNLPRVVHSCLECLKNRIYFTIFLSSQWTFSDQLGCWTLLKK